MRLAFLVPAGFLAGALLCRALLAHAPASLATDLAQPLAVVTYWQHFGAAMFAALLLALAVAGVGYVRVVRHVRDDSASVARVAAWSALACGAALLFPVVFSSDVYAYAGYGDMALHGIDPYAHAVLTLRDPLLDAVQWQWGNPPPMCVYGPAFVWLAREIAALFLPFGAAAPLWAFRVLACGALVACAPLAYAAFGSFPVRTRLAAAAGIALNPVAIWASAEGHNDALTLAVVLAGCALVQRSRVAAGALTIALSALVKAPGLIAALALVLASWGDRRRFGRAALGAAAGAAIVAAIAVPLEYGVHAHLAARGQYFPQFSVQALLALVLPLPLAVILTLCAAGALAFAGVRRLWVGCAEGPLLLALAAWIAIPNPYPWYALWMLPVAFLAWDTPAAWAILAASLTIALRYFGDATSDLAPPLVAAIVIAEFGIPLALLRVARTNRAHPDRREIHTPAPDFAPLRSP